MLLILHIKPSIELLDLKEDGILGLLLILRIIIHLR